MVPVRRHACDWLAHLARGGLVLALFVAETAIAQPSQLKPKQHQQVPGGNSSQTQSDDRGTGNRPFVVKPINPPKTPEEAAQDQQEREEKYSADRWMIGLTALLGCVGIVQAIIFAIQARVFWVQAGRLKETIVKMDEIAGRQTADMKASIAEASRAATPAVESAQASTKQANLAEQSFRDLERPYVFVDDLRLAAPEGTTDKQVALLTLANYGRTPAIMREIAFYQLIYSVPDENRAAGGGDLGSFPSNHVIGAGGKVEGIRASKSSVSNWYGGL